MSTTYIMNYVGGVISTKVFVIRVVSMHVMRMEMDNAKYM